MNFRAKKQHRKNQIFDFTLKAKLHIWKKFRRENSNNWRIKFIFELYEFSRQESALTIFDEKIQIFNLTLMAKIHIWKKGAKIQITEVYFQIIWIFAPKISFDNFWRKEFKYLILLCRQKKIGAKIQIIEELMRHFR